MSHVLSYEASVTIINCYKCGSPIALAHEDSLRRTHDEFYCPAGHPQIFSGPTEAEKKAKRLEGELATEKQRREMAEREVTMERKLRVKSESAHKRDKKRTSNGVCTCCNRTFQNLAAHMKTKHPSEIVKP